MRVRIDREQWSKSSQQSQAYDCKQDHYADISYICSKCRAAAVFSAWAQKAAFEQRKKYVHQRRRLCAGCNAEWFRLRQQEKACQMRWAKERDVLSRDFEFLSQWLEILRSIPGYAPRYRNSMARKLLLLLEQKRPNTD